MKTLGRGVCGLPVLTILVASAFSKKVLCEEQPQVLRLHSAPLRSEPAMNAGEIISLLLFGQTVQVLEESSDREWLKVKATSSKNEVIGWLHKLALKTSTLHATPAPWVAKGGEALPELSKEGPASKLARQANRSLERLQHADRHYPKAETLNAFLNEGKLGLYRQDWPLQSQGAKP